MKTIFITFNTILALFLPASIASAVDNINNNQVTKKSLCVAENTTKKSWDLVDANLVKTTSNSKIRSGQSLNFSQAEGNKKDIPFSSQLIASCLPSINQTNNSKSSVLIISMSFSTSASGSKITCQNNQYSY